MGASSAAWVLLCLAYSAVAVIPYSDQPRFESRNGHLLIVGASGANISLQTSQGGQVNINDENVLRVLEMARSAAQKVDKWENEGGGADSDGSRSVEAFLTPLSRRLDVVEMLIANGSSNLYPRRNPIALLRNVQRLNARVTRLARDLRSLRDLVEANECASGPCLHGGTCQDLFNNYHCICPDQWEGNMCQKDVDECEEFRNTGLGCQNGATCQNLPGSYNCICPPGWYGLHCTQKAKDCKAGSASMCGNGVCIDNVFGVFCQCAQGWSNDKITGMCTVDVDECAANTHPCSHDPLVRCENLPGSFKCGPCPIGYVGNGYQCRDIDECLMNNGGCSSNPMVQCINTRGSRVCGPCPPGYSGDGVSCTRVDDLCQVNRGGCHPLAQCIQNPGLTYVQCRCPAGWAGSGVGENGCVQDNRTTQLCPPSYCLNGGTCQISTDRNFYCICPSNFIGPRCEIGNRACASQPCKNNGTCVPIPGVFQSYKCLCAFGYSGDDCQHSILGCGGTLRGAEGTVSWPPLNATDLSAPSMALECRWMIVVPNLTMVINITVDYNISCSLNFLRIHDGRNSMFPATRFCGFRETSNYTSTRNIVQLIYEYTALYRNPLLTQMRQFTLNWTAVPRVCGGIINVTKHGQISSPGSPGHYPSYATCKWTLLANPEKRIQFTFFSMDIESHSSCKFDFLKIYDGTEISDTPLAVLCNKTIPPPITTSSAFATLHFQSDDYVTGTGFQLAYLPVEGVPGCGGLLNAPFGRILPPQSHKSDGSYADNLLCEWKIQMPGRDRIKLEIKNFKLEYSDGCTYDHLEIYDGPDTESRLIGRWCSESGPEPLMSSTNSLTIVFKSDASYNEGSFLIDYSTVCDVELTGPNGTITSPLYPRHYPGDRVCHYLISLPVGNAVNLRILDIDLEHKMTTITDSGEEELCLYDSLTIYDGDTTNSKVLAELCENGTISNFISSHNYMLLVFKTDVSGGGRGFAANYSSTPINCGGIFRSESGTIKSPSVNKNGMTCRWIISAPVGKVIELGWSSFLMDRSLLCLRGNLEIFENNTDPTKARQLGEKYCGDKVPPTMTSTSNIIMIVLTTSAYANTDPKFTAFYRIRSVDEACNGNFFSLNGAIQSPKYPEEYPNGIRCVWTITVPTGNQISLHFKDFLLEGRAPCRSDYLEIRNGGYATSPLIGKYCGGTISDDITSFGNQLYLSFSTDAAVTFKGFSLTWDGTTTGCGGEINGYSGAIISPNYPSPYGRNAMCVWRITVSQGSLVALNIIDIDLETHSSCLLDYLQVRDGATNRAPILGKYCSSDHPLTITSTGNSMHIQFRSDISREGRGFHLKFTTVCNRTIKGYRGVIESPEFPSAFTLPVDCTWTIEAPMGNTFTVVFSHLMIVPNRMFAAFCSEESRWAVCKRYNNCETTYLQIDEGTTTSGKTLSRFCGPQSLPTINSTFNEIKVRMKSSGGYPEVLFRLEWFVIGCGGVLKGKGYGELSTPNFPDIVSRTVVCEWTIIVDLGKSIRIDVSDMVIDKPNDCDQNFVQFFGGPDSSSPPLTKLCKSLDSSSMELHTSGNQAFVKLQVKQANKHFKFKATYDEVDSKCGGLFTAQEGNFHSKNYPRNYDQFDDCTYEISIAETHRINLTFVDFDIDSDANCTSSYVKVFDGEIDSEISNSSIQTLCGNTIPQPIISSSNKLTIRLNAGQRVAKGFNAEYSPICGTIINVTDDGVLSHTEYYDKLSNHNCTWVLRSDNLGKTITLTFTKLDIRQTPPSTPSSSPFENYIRLTIYGGVDESLPLMTLTGEVMPPSIEVPGGSATVKLYTSPDMHVSFSLLYSTLDNACGGALEADSGQFASPKYPSNYPPNIECVWTILNSPGNTLNLQIEDLRIQSSDSCNENYLEVRQTDEGGPLVGAYCGQTLPPRISTNTSLWFKFKSSTGVDKGFKASYSIGFYNELTGPSGDIESPRYPSSSIRKADYKWRITTASWTRIHLSFNEIYFEGSSTCIDKLTVFDGYDETAEVLKELCGFADSSNSDVLQSSSNVVFIVFHAIAYPAKFSLSWKQFSRSTKTQPVGSSDNCTQQLQIPLGSSVEFSSPGFPHGYGSRLKCEWILMTDPQNHVELSFSTIDLERYQRCFSDKIEVFDGVSDGSWNQLATLCHQNETERSISGSSVMKVVFSTDIFGNRTGFSARANSVCGGTLTDPDGVIILNRTEIITTTCTWNITVKPGKRIEINFNSFSFPVPTESAACSSNYLILKDGFEDDAPFLGGGKFCDKIPPKKTMITSSNKLAVIASEDTGYYISTQQMELRYITKSRTCTSNVHLSPKALRSMIIRSPNYPNMPPPHSECTWQFFAPNYETIHIEFLDRFDLAFSIDCDKEYLELRDGSTELSPLLGRYCYSTPPPFVMTESNALFIKYFTDMQFPNNGFKAKVSLSDCGGTYHDFYVGSIESPGYPSSYDTSVNCVWRFINPDIDLFKLSVENFNLGYRFPYHQPILCNASTMDTLNITLVNRADPDRSEYWIVCGRNFTAPKEITGNELLVNFTAGSIRSVVQRRQNELGFKLKLRAEKSKCGGYLNLPSGEIKSPGYPGSPRSTYCTWRITVPKGRRVTLNMTDFDLEIKPSHYSPHVQIYNDFNFQSNLARWNGSLPAGTSVSTSDNQMLIYYSTMHPSGNRGFRGFYSSDLPSLCSADGLDQPTGLIRVDLKQPFVCDWEVISKESNQTSTTFNVVGTVDQSKVDAMHCYKADSHVEFHLGSSMQIEFCSVAEPSSPFVIVSPFPSTRIKVISESIKANANYTISWVTRKCGGEYDLEGKTTITSPTIDGRYPPNYDCTWKISYPDETTIKIQFNSLDLDMTGSTVSDCSSDYLSIYNGHTPQSPIISKSCGTIVPADLLTLSNNLFIHFHSDALNQAKGFSITLSPAQEACGGILHENTGTIMSVNYPNQYPNSSNCNFEIRVDKGYHIGLTFVERFYIEDSPGCIKDYVEVFNFDEASESWKSLGKVCGRLTPKIFNSTSNKMRVHFKSDDSIEGDGFKAVWTINCGGVFDGSKPGVIHSPHYPRDYDGDLSCNYTVNASDPSKILFGSFETFDLEPRTSRGCAYDFIDIWYYSNKIPATLKQTPTFLGKYCGPDAPPRFLSYGSFKMSFVTDRFTEFKGFLLKYGPEECGGTISQPTVIRNPFNTQKMWPVMNCTWKITAPTNQVVVIKIQDLALGASRGCNFGKARIWDGDSVLPNNTNLLAILCGSLTDRSGLYRTSSENAIINLYTPAYVPSRKFVAQITFSPGPKDGCGGRVVLKESDTQPDTVIASLINPAQKFRGFQGTIDCVWTINAPSSMTVSAAFTRTNIDSCVPRNDTNIVEFYDGIDENSELIGRYNCSTIPSKITSSRSFLTIKFSTDGEVNGFSTSLRALKSPCGIRLLNVTDVAQVLTSPSYPENYPSNIHCSWMLYSKYPSFYIRVEEVDIVQSPGCTNDSLKIRDIGMAFPFTAGLLSNGGDTKVYIGNSRLNNLKATMHMGSRYPFSTSIFCGTRKGVDYYSSSDLVMVKFVSSSTQTSKGFKIIYSSAGCNRNFTSVQGRIKVSNQRTACVMQVIAPDANSTISLYFSELRAYTWPFRGDGGQDIIKIVDGMDVKQDSKVLLAIKNSGIRTPEPVFSNSSSLTISITPGSMPVSFDITYTTTTAGRGCGGYIFNYGGIFTSPLYPLNVRNFTTCRWDVAVPVGGAIELEFTTFELGPKRTVKTDYLQIYDVDPDTGAEVLRRTYYGGDNPAKYTGATGKIAVRYVTSIHNGGIGWVARFMSRSIDPSWPALVGQHLIA